MPIETSSTGASQSSSPLKSLRSLHGLTQANLAERLGVTERQVQRWEAGEGSISDAHWQLLGRTVGIHTARDFEPAPDGMTRGRNPDRDVPRDTIERGDVVELQPFDGPRLSATVCASHIGDTHSKAGRYEAIVTEFVGAGEPGEECRGFWLGERVRFDRQNVIHLEQRAPRAAARSTGA